MRPADENLSPRLVRRVASRFPDSRHVEGAGLSVGNAGTQEIGELLQRNEARIVSFLESPEESLLVLELSPGDRV